MNRLAPCTGLYLAPDSIPLISNRHVKKLCQVGNKLANAPI